jgi:hypothetical protein
VASNGLGQEALGAAAAGPEPPPMTDLPPGPHSSLGYRTPEEFAHHAGQMPADSVRKPAGLKL